MKVLWNFWLLKSVKIPLLHLYINIYLIKIIPAFIDIYRDKEKDLVYKIFLFAASYAHCN